MKMTISGTPDQVAAKVRQLEEMGVHHLHLRFMGEIDGETAYVAKESAELFAREVMPRFGQTKAGARARAELVGAR
jgi:alkanesulfonate monooxygenase SsuD/methylene tetrahydromethanopterin reductase-like flavin-dependent oxidoreductase (luciferase family)